METTTLNTINKRNTLVKLHHQAWLLHDLLMSMRKTVDGTNTFESEVEDAIEGAQNLCFTDDFVERLMAHEN